MNYETIISTLKVEIGSLMSANLQTLPDFRTKVMISDVQEIVEGYFGNNCSASDLKNQICWALDVGELEEEDVKKLCTAVLLLTGKACVQVRDSLRKETIH